MLSIHSSEQIKSVTMVVTVFFYSGCLFSKNYFSSFALSVFVSLSMTPDDKRDLIMPSLDRRTKGRSLSFLLFVLCQVGKEEKGEEEEEEEKRRIRYLS
jgi:hypothetical protein